MLTKLSKLVFICIFFILSIPSIVLDGPFSLIIKPLFGNCDLEKGVIRDYRFLYCEMLKLNDFQKIIGNPVKIFKEKDYLEYEYSIPSRSSSYTVRFIRVFNNGEIEYFSYFYVD